MFIILFFYDVRSCFGMANSYVDLAVTWAHVIIDPRWLNVLSSYGVWVCNRRSEVHWDTLHLSSEPSL